MDEELRDALDAAAGARGLSRSALVRQALLAVVDLDLVALGLRRRTVTEFRAGLRRDSWLSGISPREVRLAFECGRTRTQPRTAFGLAGYRSLVVAPLVLVIVTLLIAE